MQLSCQNRLGDGIVERASPLVRSRASCGPRDPTSPAPLILLGHPGGPRHMYPRLLGRARRSIADGFAAASIELPGSGDRPRMSALDAVRTELRRAPGRRGRRDDIVDRLILPLIDQAVPEWQAPWTRFLRCPRSPAPSATRGVISIGVRLAAVEPRIVATGLFAGSFIPRAILEQARGVKTPVHVLLQWDDEGNDRQATLALFDALGSTEKTLNANMGGHTGVPTYAADDAARFFARHLKSAARPRRLQ